MSSSLRQAGNKERHAAFEALAEERYASIPTSSKTIPWREIRVYLEERIASKIVKRPVARKLTHWNATP